MLTIGFWTDVVFPHYKKNDDHQFHRYQYNEQSPLFLTELTEHKKHHDI